MPQDLAPVGGRKVFVKTYGCQMNVYDSERIEDALRPHGYTSVATAQEADLVVLNTCHIREKAADKVYSEIGRLRELKTEKLAAGSPFQIAVAGCVAQAEGAEMARRAPAVDAIVGPQSYHRLPDILARAEAAGAGQIETEFPVESKFDRLPVRRLAARAPAAFVTVQEGCDKFCSFCVVPYTRGSEYSRPVVKIVQEVRSLVEAGVREVTLLGQNVNAYHGEGPDGRDWRLARLIAQVSEIDDLARIRYMTSHPSDMDDALIAEHGRNTKLMPFLHLPVQSGSDRILAAMNRRHTVAQYRRIIDRVRSGRPDLALSTDLIVGFPGETEDDFAATVALVEEIGFALAFSFKYSPRPGTPAASRDEQVGEVVMTRRLHVLQEQLFAQQKAFNLACIGNTLPVLFEKPGRISGQLAGRSPYLQAVHATAPAALIGHIAQVRVSSATLTSLGGAIAANGMA